MKVIITGSTGMVGEGVLLVCLQNDDVTEVLMINRRHNDLAHPKLKELIITDFSNIGNYAEQLKGYDGCFFCAGVSSVGKDEKTFYKLTFDVVVPFATTLSHINPDMVFNYVSGKSTDSTEKGNVMWARVKGKTENTLQQLPFRKQYNFRPGFMKPVKGQKNVQSVIRVFEVLYPVLKPIFPNWACTMQDVGMAMINSVSKGYSKPVLEVADIKTLAKQ